MSLYALDTVIDKTADIIARDMAQDLDDRWWEFARKTAVQERRFKPKLRALFQKQRKMTLERMKESKDSYIEFLKQKAKGEKASYDTESWWRPEEWGFTFQQMERPFVTSTIKKSAEEALTELGAGIEFDVTNPRIAQLIDEKVFKFSFEVNETTTKMLRAQFRAGLENGESIDQMQKRVKQVFDIAETYRTERIARTEIIGSTNRGTLEGYRSSGIVSTKIWLATRDSLTRDSHAAIDGEEVGLEELFSIGILHPGAWNGPPEEIINCLIDPKVPIFTSNGWKPIGELQVGERVLTHKNRFMPVAKIFEGKAYGGEVVKIKLRSDQYLTMTPEHRVLMSDGTWRKAEDIQEGEQIKVLATYCRRCHTIIPWWRTYCSNRCCSLDITDRQWSDHDHRTTMSRKASEQLKREYANGVRDKEAITEKARQVCFEKYGNGGYFGTVRKDKEFQERIKQGVIEKYGSHLEMLKGSAFKALGEASWKGSRLETSMKGYLDAQEKKYIPQYWVGKRRIDFYIPAEKMFIECDSPVYHSDIEKERKRDLEILTEYPDHQIAHVMYGQNPPKWEIFNLESLNHTGTFSQIDMPVMKVEKWKLKQPRRLYNFAVEEDESYMANGIVCHNCRCTMLAGLVE